MTSTPETTPQPERRKPRAEYRELALTLAVDVAKAHTDLHTPGPYALIFAAQFADFLENGAAPEPEKEDDK